MTGLIEEAATLVAPQIALQLRVLGWLRAASGAVLGAVVRYPWPCATGAALIAAAWCWHGWSAEQAARMAERAKWADAFGREQHAYGVLSDALARQSASVRALGALSATRTRTADDAAAAALQRQRGALAAADAIHAHRAPPHGADPACTSSEAVMAAKGDF